MVGKPSVTPIAKDCSSLGSKEEEVARFHPDEPHCRRGNRISLTWLHRKLQIRPQPSLSKDGPRHITHRRIPAECPSVRSGESNADLMTFSQECGCRPHADLQFGGFS